MSRRLRLALTLGVTLACTAYLLLKIDVSQTIDVIAGADPSYLLGAVAIMLVTVVPMAWRWKRLLAARGITDHLPWLFRAYLVAYTAGQILPTAVGGDAMRVYESSRRHAGRTGDLAGSVVLERALGGAATLALAAVGFVLAIGRYDVGAFLWIEGFFVALTLAMAVLFFSRTLRRPLGRLSAPLARVRLERPVRGLYQGIHAYRDHVGVLIWATALTLVIQAVRVLAIWLTGKAVGVDLSPRLYYVMGPMLFLVMLVPFTINGLAVREAFFVSFLGAVGIGADAAFATGFLFFLVTILMAVPGGLILAWEGLRGATRPPRVADG
jgi:glycosyltransferase 2 family protein